MINPSSPGHSACRIMPKIAQRVLVAIQDHGFSFSDTDATSVVDWLYCTYADCLERDPQEIQDGFLALDNHLSPLTLDANNTVFSNVCELSGAYEKRAFKDVLQLGAYLVLELYRQDTTTPSAS